MKTLLQYCNIQLLPLFIYIIRSLIHRLTYSFTRNALPLIVGIIYNISMSFRLFLNNTLSILYRVCMNLHS